MNINDLLLPSIDIEEIKNKIFPYFVQFYGKKYEDYIRDKFDNCLEFVFYNSFDSVKTFLYERDSKERLRMSIEFLEENGIIIDDNTKDAIIENDMFSYFHSDEKSKRLLSFIFEEVGYTPSNFICFKQAFCNEDINQDIKLNKKVEFLKRMGFDVSIDDLDDFFKTDEGIECSKFIDKQRKIISKLDLKYNSYQQKNAEIINSISLYDKARSDINNRYLALFLNDISSYLSIDDIEKLKSGDLYFYKYKSRKAIFANLNIGGFIEAFSSSNEELLNNEDTPSNIKQNIISKRLSYFNLCGLNPNNLNYDELMNILDKKVIPSVKMADFIVEKRENYQATAKKECSLLNLKYDSILDKVHSMGLLFDDYPSPEQLLESGQFTSANVRKSTLREVGIVYFSLMNNAKNTSDVFLMHEINHVLELMLISLEGDKAVYKSGFAIYDNSADELSGREQLSETINQDIAIEITKLMHNDGVFIFDDKRRAKESGVSSYEHSNMLIGDFYQKYKENIIESRLSSDLSSLTDEVGINNFNKLNRVVNEFSQINYLSFFKDFKSGVDSDIVHKAGNLIKESVVIFNDMNHYSDSYNSVQSAK